MAVTESDRRVRPFAADGPVPRLDRGAVGLGAALVSLALFRFVFAPEFTPAIRSWATVFLAVALQALPFLALGVTVSGLVAALVSPALLRRIIPSGAGLGVPAAAFAGALLPGCECASVPVSARLMAQGMPSSAALAFLVASPAINPVVMVATAVAFPGQPRMVVARFLASLLAAIIVGWTWSRWGPPPNVEPAAEGSGNGSRFRRFASTSHHDLLHAGGYLVLGAAATATLQTIVPRSVLDGVARTGVLSVLALAVLAVILAVCSEADAFVVAGLSTFSLTSRLAFLVVGPMVDLKLIALHVGTFGKHFAVRFGPLVFVTAVVSASVVGSVLL